MEKITIGNVPFYQFHNFSTFLDIQHFVTSRKGGVSSSPYYSLNIGFGTDDKISNVLENRTIMAQSAGIPLENFVFLQQVHGGKVAQITHLEKGSGALDKHTAIKETDGLVTNEKGICLFVMGADCVPILFYDPVKKVIGACHAGWRGTLLKIAEKTVSKMSEIYGTNPEHVLAGIGPSIGQCCYNVGPEVVEAVQASFGATENIIHFKETNPYLDLWLANQILLQQIGVNKINIEIARICTQCHADQFFSSRAGKGITGRFGAGILLK